MSTPSLCSKRAIRTMALKHGLSISQTQLSGHLIRIHTLYAGGGHLNRLLDSVNIAFVQTGAKGRWLAILPAEELMDLLQLAHPPMTAQTAQGNRPHPIVRSD